MTVNDQIEKITLFTLNIEGDRHLERLQKFITEYSPTILTLQEIFQRDAEMIAKKYGYNCHYLALTLAKTKTEPIQEHPWGLAILTKLTVKNIQNFCYVGENLPVQSFAFDKHPNDDCLRRGFINLELASSAGRSIRIMTTKFTWTPDSKASEEQRQDLVAFHDYLRQYTSFILAGDFNAPRGGEIYTKIKDNYIDWLPANIKSTLDPELHKVGNLELAVDSIFSTSDYQLESVEVKIGLSDHCGILATIKVLAETEPTIPE